MRACTTREHNLVDSLFLPPEVGVFEIMFSKHQLRVDSGAVWSQRGYNAKTCLHRSTCVDMTSFNPRESFYSQRCAVFLQYSITIDNSPHLQHFTAFSSSLFPRPLFHRQITLDLRQSRDHHPTSHHRL